MYKSKFERNFVILTLATCFLGTNYGTYSATKRALDNGLSENQYRQIIKNIYKDSGVIDKLLFVTLKPGMELALLQHKEE